MEIADQIIAVAGSLGVPADLALRVADRESGFNQAARGAAGEIGIFQLMPGTAAEMGVNPLTVDGNIRGGVGYLAKMLGTFGGDPFKATAAYNCGPGCVGTAIQKYGADWFDHIPGSTQSYVLAVVPAAPAPGGGPYQPEPGIWPGFTSLPIPTIAPEFQPLAVALLLGGAALLAFAASDGDLLAWD